MELKDILLLLGGAILGYLVQLLGDRWRNVSDDYELWAELVSSSIETREDGIGAQLEYVWDGRTVQHPHVADLYIWSVGKRDITSDQFDAGRSLTFQLGVPIVGELDGSSFAAMEETRATVSSTGSVVMGPSIIRKRMAGHYRFITDGEPTLETSNPVADLAVGAIGHHTSTSLRRTLKLLGGPLLKGGGVVVGLSGFVLLICLLSADQVGSSSVPVLQPIVNVVAVAMLLGGFIAAAGIVLVSLADAPPRRVRRAVRILRRSLGDKTVPYSLASGQPTKY